MLYAARRYLGAAQALAWPPSDLDIVTRRHGTPRKSRAIAYAARGVPVFGRGRENFVRGQGEFAAQPGAILFHGVALAGCEDRIAGTRDCRRELHRRGQSEGSAGAGKQPDQATQAEI